MDEELEKYVMSFMPKGTKIIVNESYLKSTVYGHHEKFLSVSRSSDLKDSLRRWDEVAPLLECVITGDHGLPVEINKQNISSSFWRLTVGGKAAGSYTLKRHAVAAAPFVAAIMKWQSDREKEHLISLIGPA